MSEKRIPKFSTLPMEECWWRADINPSDIVWVRQNLRRGVEGLKHFDTTSQDVALAGALYPDCPWTDRVAFIDGEDAPRVLIGLGGKYNYRLAYSTSREKRDPYQSPHGLFRSLEAGYHVHAFQFMKQFGPLFINTDTRLPGESWWISLSDFWKRQARFVAIAELWEDRFDTDKLRAHWSFIGEHHEKLNQGGAAPLGYIPDEKNGHIRLCSMLPWEMPLHIKELLDSDRFLQRLVYELLHCELILHTQNCVQTWTRRTVNEDSNEDEVFEPTRAFTSLWSAIWELFGLDTRQYAGNFAKSAVGCFIRRIAGACVAAQSTNRCGASDNGQDEAGATRNSKRGQRVAEGRRSLNTQRDRPRKVWRKSTSGQADTHRLETRRAF